MLLESSALHRWKASAEGELGTSCLVASEHLPQSSLLPSPRCQDPLTSRRCRQVRPVQWALMVCACCVVKRDELWWSPKVMGEVHVCNRYTGNRGCDLDSLFHWEGGWFSDDTKSVSPLDLRVREKCFAVTVSWLSEAVLLHRKPWTPLSHIMQRLIFPGTFARVHLRSSSQLPGSDLTSPLLSQRRC